MRICEPLRNSRMAYVIAVIAISTAKRCRNNRGGISELQNNVFIF
jgi:hypothetical protein